MSKIDIEGTIENIKTRTNAYTPIIEAIVNSIEAIDESKNPNGKILVKLIRENVLENEIGNASVSSIEIHDNGIGFNKRHRDSFDTFYSPEKRKHGGKGFGRFMYVKYFGEVKVESVYKENGIFFLRRFNFGKKNEIIANETDENSNENSTRTTIYLKNIKNKHYLDKGLETISRKILEKILIYFADDTFKCPEIIISEYDDNNKIVLNNYLNQGNEINLLDTSTISVNSKISERYEEFKLRTFKIYYSGNQSSRISLTAHNREVTESPIHHYIPEFIDEFYDEYDGDNGKLLKKNFIIKTYVIGDYLNQTVSHERETFNFDKNIPDPFYPISQIEIENEVAENIKKIFVNDVHKRFERKKQNYLNYAQDEAPWHIPYIKEIDFTNLPYKVSNDKMETELQKAKFSKELESKAEIKKLIESDDGDYDELFNKLSSKITNIGKSDLARYVSNRKVILQLLDLTLKRREDGKGELEKEIHNLIYPMGKTSQDTKYEDHNLWLIDERLVFSEYIASDKKMSAKKAPGEPDLVIFDKRKAFRSGENELSNPLTIIEFKRPKREDYRLEEDPIRQIGAYLKEIRAGNYETPDTIEKIKVNENTPVYGYIICDITPKIKEFAADHQLTLSPDQDGYFGYHKGYNMYIEVISFSKLRKDASLRNKIFFKQLQLE